MKGSLRHTWRREKAFRSIPCPAADYPIVIVDASHLVKLFQRNSWIIGLIKIIQTAKRTRQIRMITQTN